jgi:dienelactone hydrolase
MRAPWAAGPLVLFAVVAFACSGGGSSPAAPAGCTVPTPALGTTPAAVALATSPQQCGQKAFTWLSSPTLGEVTSHVLHETYYPAALGVALAVFNVPFTTLHAVDVDVVHYTTQDRGKLLTASAEVAYPNDLAAHATPNVVLLLHGTAGFTDSCAPSAVMQNRVLAASIAGLGYVVVAPDYIGLENKGQTGFLHPYLVGQPTAIASLDSVRAGLRVVQARTDLGICATTEFVTVGGSQGGHAALWVDRLAPYYAPELVHDGVAATVPPADLESEANRALTQVVSASSNVGAFFVASSDWYGTTSRLSGVFVPPQDTQLYDQFHGTCSPSIVTGTSLSAVYQPAILSAAVSTAGVASDGTWGCLVAENGLLSTSVPRVGSHGPGYGILFALGEDDTIVNTPIEQKSFDTLCAQGLPLQFLECAGAGHVQTTQWALPEIVAFVAARFAHEPIDPALRCKRGGPVHCLGELGGGDAGTDAAGD